MEGRRGGEGGDVRVFVFCGFHSACGYELWRGYHAQIRLIQFHLLSCPRRWVQQRGRIHIMSARATTPRTTSKTRTNTKTPTHPRSTDPRTPIPRRPNRRPRPPTRNKIRIITLQRARIQLVPAPRIRVIDDAASARACARAAGCGGGCGGEDGLHEEGGAGGEARGVG